MANGFSSINAILGAAGVVEPRRRRKPPGLPGKKTQRVGRNALPTVGLRAAGEVRLSPRLRQRLRKRAATQARREFRPVIRAIRSQRELLENRQARALSADEQAVQAASRFASQAAGEASSGAARRDIAAQAADIAGSLPGLQRQTRGEFRPEFEQIALELTNARADRGTARAQLIQQLFDDARASGLQSIQARQDARSEVRGGGLTPFQRLNLRQERADADVLARQALRQGLESLDKDTPGELTPDEATQLVEAVIEAGVRPAEAQAAVRRLLARLR